MWSSRSPRGALRSIRTPLTRKCAMRMGTRSAPARVDQRLVVDGRDAGDPSRVLAVPLAGLLHEIDDPALAQERERRDHRRHAELVGAEQAAFVRPLHGAGEEARSRGASNGASASNSSGESWLPASATTGRRSASRRSVWSPSVSASIGGIGRSHTSPGDEDQVDRVLVGDALDLGEHVDELVHAVVPAQPLADVPVRRVEDLHVRGEGVAGRVTGPRTDRRRRPSPLPPSWWPTAGTGT